MTIKKVLLNILMMIIAVAVALVISELLIRAVKPVYDYRDRSLLFSSPVFKLYSGGAVRYQPNERIREAAVYNGTIEYDVQYTTNNMGFVDTINYGNNSQAGKNFYAFVGDSFTTGVNGGAPWVAKLRNNKLRAEVYNFGVAATGFEHFYKLMHEMKDKVRITHIVIVAITDDFFRGYWHPLMVNGNINFCSLSGSHQVCMPVPVASIMPLDAPEAELLEISKTRYKEIRARVNEINAANSLQAKLESLFYDDSALYYYAKLLHDTYKRSHQSGNIDNAIEMIRKIKSEYPLAEMHLIHLPQKYEVSTGNYHINIADQIKMTGVGYFPALEKCSWSVDMFFKRDAHPNKSGYENIEKCISEYLHF